jgi:xylulokinase
VDLLLGIDMGTTHIKVATFDFRGNLQTLEMARTKTVALDAGQAMYEPNEIWETVTSLVRKTTAQLPPRSKIHSVSVASMGEAGLLLDEDGAPLTPIIPWFDERSKEVMDAWYDLISPAQCFGITGLNYNHIYSLFKILWLKKNQPEIFGRAAKWLCLPDYIYFRLTKQFATDYSIASRTMLFDVQEKKWSNTLLNLAELDESLLPEPCPSGTVIGVVNQRAAAETGLMAGIPVSVGGHDHICGALATGVVKPGRVLDSLGTAESLVAAVKDLPELKLEEFGGFNVGCHVVPGLHYLQGGIDSSGISFEWFLDNFSRGPEGTRDSYQTLFTEARKSPLGARGLYFIPHLRGEGPPVCSPFSRGSFLGIRDYHTKADFSRSIHEGLCYEMHNSLKSMEQVAGIGFERICAIGGGTQNELWMEIKSTVIRKPVEIPAVQEATLLGAALLGGVGAKVYGDHYQASQAVYQVSHVYQPQEDSIAIYSELSRTYSELLPLVRQISQIIGR